MTRPYRQSIHYKLLLVLIVAASCVRVFVCFQHNPMDYLISDMLRHWSNGVGFPRGGYTGAADPIIYQIYVSVLHHLSFDNRIVVALASALLSVLMPWTYYRAARDFGLGKIPALWVWVLIALTPSLITIYHYVMMETLLLFVQGVALWMTARYLRKGGLIAFLVFIFCWTVASLTKPTVVPLAVICSLWVWWKKSTPVRDIALGALLAAVMLVPQAIRTRIELGFVAPFGNPWLAKLMLRSGARATEFHFYTHAIDSVKFDPNVKDADMIFSSPSCYIMPLYPLSDWTMRRARITSKARVLISSVRGERDWKLAYDSFNNDPDEWVAEWRENIILFFFAQSWPDSNWGQWDGWLCYQSRWLWAPLTLVVFVGNIREFLARRFALIPVAVTLFTLMLALQNVVITEGRYRKPVEPLLLLNLVWVLSSKSLSSAHGGELKAVPAEASEAAV